MKEDNKNNTKLNKSSILKNFKKIFKENSDFLIVKTHKERVLFIKNLKEKIYNKDIRFKHGNLENKIKQNTHRYFAELELEKTKGHNGSFFDYDYYNSYYAKNRISVSEAFKDKYDYAKYYYFKNYPIEAFFLEKYSPSKKAENELLMLNIKTSSLSRTIIDLFIYFDENHRLKIDISTRTYQENDIKDLKEDIDFISKYTNEEEILSFFNKFDEMKEKIKLDKEKNDIRRKKRRKKYEKIKALKERAIISRIKEILKGKSVKYEIDSYSNAIVTYLYYDKGYTSIHIPNKAIMEDLIELENLFITVINANKSKIEIRYKRN